MVEREKKYLFSVAIIVILGIAVYANSLTGEFVFDDDYLVKNNLFIRSFSNVKEIFTHTIGAGAGHPFVAYRPVQILSYAVDYSWWGLDARGYHLTNVILHIAVAVCLWMFINVMFDRWLLSLCAAALFVVHPVHTEAVSYISGRADSLACIFLLLSFIYYLKSLHSDALGRYIVMYISFISALLSREISLFFPLAILIYHYVFKERIKLKIYLSLVIISFVYLFVRVYALRAPIMPLLVTSSFFQRIPGFFIAVVNYIRILILPIHLHMEYSAMLFRYTNPKFLLGVILLILILVEAYKAREKNKVLSFSIFWFILWLLPVSNIYPVNAYMAEHWLYIPSIGFFIILSNSVLSLIQKIRYPKGNRVSFSIMITLVAVYSVFTVRQNRYWRDPSTFYNRTLKYSPESGRIYNSLGASLYREGKKGDALKMYEKAIKIEPGYAEAYNNLAVLLGEDGEKDRSIALYEKSIKLKPDYADALANLGNAYYENGQRDKAKEAYLKALEINPSQARACYSLGITYVKDGNSEKAIGMFKKAIKINPIYVEAYNNLGVAYYNIGRTKEAEGAFMKALQIDPTNKEAASNLVTVRTEK